MAMDSRFSGNDTVRMKFTSSQSHSSVSGNPELKFPIGILGIL